MYVYGCRVADVTKDSHLLAEARQTAKAIHNKTYFDSPSVAAAARPWLDLSEELFCTAHRPSVENEEEEEVDEDITAEAARASDKFIRSDEDSLSNVKSSGYSTLRKMDSSCVVDLHDTSSYACVVVDLETSGFSPSRDRIIQLGAALLPPSPPSAGSSFHSRQHYAEVKPESAFFGIHPPVAANIGKAPTPAENPLVESVDKIETFDAYIRPDEYFWLSPAVTEMTGISKEMLRRDGVPFTAAWDLFSDWLRQFSSGRPVVILAHNGKNFDFKFLHAELVRYNRLEDLKRLRIASFVDTLTVLRDKSLWRSDGASSLPAPSSLSLPELHRTLCGQVLRDAHDASADSAAVARILGHSALRDKWRIVANRTQYSSLV
jgi:DNA polymerase III epsilon subunit-like protein